MASKIRQGLEQALVTHAALAECSDKNGNLMMAQVDSVSDASARPTTIDSAKSKAYLIGGGIASMAAAAFLVRDGDFLGRNITIFEELGDIGGSLDGSGSAEKGYVLRGGRMLESKYLCTYELFSSIPTLDESKHPDTRPSGELRGKTLKVAVKHPAVRFEQLRSIADIARSEGEDLSDPETALACVEVFALGGRPGSADASESGYFTVRGMLAKTVTEAARFVAERGLLKEGAPILLKFVTQVAARFGLVVTQKVAAQALPLVGAIGGAAVNYAFIEHFQDVARGHFTVRRLERLYGKELIRSQYDLIAGQL